jgi:hypothetical protein
MTLAVNCSVVRYLRDFVLRYPILPSSKCSACHDLDF